MVIFEKIAAEAMTSIISYVTKKVSLEAIDATEKIYQTIKAEFSNDSYAEQTLKRVEENPTSKGGQTTLEEIMTKKMKEDPVFAEKIQNLVNDVNKVSGSINVIASGHGAIAIGGNVNGSPIIAGNNNVIGDREVKEKQSSRKFSIEK